MLLRPERILPEPLIGLKCRLHAPAVMGLAALVRCASPSSGQLRCQGFGNSGEMCIAF